MVFSPVLWMCLELGYILLSFPPCTCTLMLSPQKEVGAPVLRSRKHGGWSRFWIFANLICGKQDLSVLVFTADKVEHLFMCWFVHVWEVPVRVFAHFSNRLWSFPLNFSYGIHPTLSFSPFLLSNFLCHSFHAHLAGIVTHTAVEPSLLLLVGSVLDVRQLGCWNFLASFSLFICIWTLYFLFLSCPLSGKCLLHSQQFVLCAGALLKESPGRSILSINRVTFPPLRGTSTIIQGWAWQCLPDSPSPLSFRVKTSGYLGGFLFSGPADALLLPLLLLATTQKHTSLCAVHGFVPMRLYFEVLKNTLWPSFIVNVICGFRWLWLFFQGNSEGLKN